MPAVFLRAEKVDVSASSSGEVPVRKTIQSIQLLRFIAAALVAVQHTHHALEDRNVGSPSGLLLYLTDFGQLRRPSVFRHHRIYFGLRHPVAPDHQQQQAYSCVVGLLESIRSIGIYAVLYMTAVQMTPEGLSWRGTLGAFALLPAHASLTTGVAPGATPEQSTIQESSIGVRN